MNVKKTALISLVLFIWTACENNNTTSSDSETNTSWVFVANEGEMGESNGSISMIDDFGNVYETESIGDVVQSLEVYKDKLIVIVNNSHKIVLYDITENDGIKLPSVTVSTENSSPREMAIVNDNIYFTNWKTKDVKILNLQNNQLEESTISLNGRPEDIIFDGTYIWVSIPELYESDGNQGTEVAKIDPGTNEVIEYIDVGKGPTQLTEFNNSIFISRTYYEYEGIDDNGWWINPQIHHGTSKISDIINIQLYGAGSACGGSILSYNNQVYRSFGGGIAPIKDNLDIDELGRLGSYEQNQVYHVEIINDNIWFCITNWSDINLVKVVNNNGQEIASYTAGIMPGDLAYWHK
ncbi:MAG: hypothetical protein QF380_02095 [Candidatus Marinimicrobia bacterium]|jgi:hypothetical protein|nr:hypothetical protein [Candidatus Neomarinimicrobiota bacterium]